MVKLYCDDATYERLKLYRYRHDKILEEIERLNVSIQEAVAEGKRALETHYRQQRVALIKAKDGLNEYLKILEAECFVGRDED